MGAVLSALTISADRHDADGGRLVLFEPDMSALGAVVYGVFHHEPVAWKIVEVTRLASLSYVTSGGFRGRQLYPDALYPAVTRVDRIADLVPSLFSTRLLVVLERRRRAA